MDVRINQMNSTVTAGDSSGLLSPELLSQIVEAVLVRLQAEQRLQREREQDMRIETRATRLDG